MPAQASLSASDREFFQWVDAAAFGNPFDPERAVLDRKIAGATFRDDRERAEVLRRAVTGRVEKIAAVGLGDVRGHAGDEREMMRRVFLFEAYHVFFAQLDALIDTQMKAGDAAAPVTFAGELMALLERRGFSEHEARRFLGIFFQVRRAHYFIVQGLIGESACMSAFRLRLWNNVFTHDIRCYERYLWDRMEDFSTLLLGETGTGKGTAAAAIGRSGFIPFDERKGHFAESFTHGFVSLNLSQYPETLIESELFGHRKGAFTGAVDAHEGVFARCSPHGAIFLDEIGDVSEPVQIKLLQVLQERSFSPVGSRVRQRFRGRVIAATNQPLDRLRRDQVFRNDFFYRLCSDVITVPPLRQRIAESPGELKFLVSHVVTRTVGSETPELVEFAMESLGRTVGRHYPWPGNVRELEQAVRRILLTSSYEGDSTAVSRDARTELLSDVERGVIDAETLLARYCGLLHQRHATIEEVARRTNLDRRTVKRYLAMEEKGRKRKT